MSIFVRMLAVCMSDPQDTHLGSQSSDPAQTKPPPDRLYGRSRGHRLRARQRLLLERTLPRLAFDLADLRRFPARWLEVGFGGGEHALAQIAAHPDALL